MDDLKLISKFLLNFRFGWFVPTAFASHAPPIKDHWRAFLDENIANMFSLDRDDLAFVKRNAKTSEGR